MIMPMTMRTYIVCDETVRAKGDWPRRSPRPVQITPEYRVTPSLYISSLGLLPKYSKPLQKILSFRDVTLPKLANFSSSGYINMTQTLILIYMTQTLILDTLTNG